MYCLHTGQERCPVPLLLASQPSMQRRQKEWPHGVQTGSSKMSRQMGHVQARSTTSEDKGGTGTAAAIGHDLYDREMTPKEMAPPKLCKIENIVDKRI